MTIRQCPQIALLIDTATDWGRRMIRGIGRYAQQHGGWGVGRRNGLLLNLGQPVVELL